MVGNDLVGATITPSQRSRRQRQRFDRFVTRHTAQSTTDTGRHTSMSRTINVLLASVATVALVAGCGGSDSSGANTSDPVVVTDAGTVGPVATTPDDPTATSTAGDPSTTTASTAATEDDLVAAFATNYAIFDDDDANTCVGQAFVDFVGLDQLQENGTTPGDLAGIIQLEDAGLTVSADDLPAAVAALAACGDLASVALDTSSATAEQTACAAQIVTNDLAAEQLLVQVSALEPSAELSTARDALGACTAG